MTFFSGELSALFAAYGSVLEASVIKDYGFVVSREKTGIISFDAMCF